MTKIFRPIPQALTSLRTISALSLIALALTGCGGGGASAIGITPNTPQILDSGQSLTITAAVVNDSTAKGASFAVTGPGTLSTAKRTAVSSTSYETTVYTAPTVTAQATATVTATALNTPAQTASVTITINPTLSIATTTIPSATAGVPYTTTLASAGGTSPYNWVVASGTLPTGITLAPTTGILSGTPSVAGTFNFAVALTDSSAVPLTVTQSYTLNVSPTITTSTLPNGIAGTAYSQLLASSGGAGGVFAVTSGSLPTGLTLSPAGAITGTPAASTAGTTSAFSVTVSIGSAVSKPVSISITIDALPVVTTTALPSGNVGIAYSQQLAYTGGSGGTPTWAITAGSLPASSGLTLNPTTGIINGTPTTASTYSFSVAVTIGTQTSVAQALTLVINSLVITSGSGANGEVGLPFGFQLTAAGGTGPYTWSLAPSSNALPTGLTLNAATGYISGTLASNAGSPYGGIVIEATDHLGATATQAMTFTINPGRSSANNALLSGQYAFLLNGVDASGNPFAMAGNFTADGHGNITAGQLDANGTGLSAPSLSNTLSETSYSVGPDERGKLTLSYGTSTLTFVLALNNGNGGSAPGGYLTEFDSTGQSLTGQLALTTPAAFTTASIAGGFAFGLDGFAYGSTATSLTRRAVIGEMQFNGTGGGTSELLSSAIGTTPQASSTSTIAIAPNGRGTLSFTFPNGLPTLNLIAYVVSSSRVFVLSSGIANDSGTHDLLSGQLLQQTVTSGSFSAASLNATSVLRMQRLSLNATNTLVPDAQVGLLTFTGAGHLALTSDENNGGVVTSNSDVGTYTVANNGRVAMTLQAGLSGCTNCVSAQTYLYLVGLNQGFLMDFATSANVGYFEPQTATGIGNATFTGSYSAGTLAPLSGSNTDSSASLSSTGVGAITGTADRATAGTLTPDVALSESYSLATSGRGTIATTGNGQVLYIISPTKALLLDLTSNSPIVQEVTHQ